MADEEKQEYFPQRTENILSGESQPPPMVHASSSTDVGDDEVPELTRVQTTRTMARERTFEPILSGDRAELTRIASNFSSTGDSIARTNTRRSELQRRDTLAGVELHDEVLNPNSPEFDAYKWTRMYESFNYD